MTPHLLHRNIPHLGASKRGFNHEKHKKKQEIVDYNINPQARWLLIFSIFHFPTLFCLWMQLLPSEIIVP